jgi:hypothetical protein
LREDQQGKGEYCEQELVDERDYCEEQWREAGEEADGYGDGKRKEGIEEGNYRNLKVELYWNERTVVEHVSELLVIELFKKFGKCESKSINYIRQSKQTTIFLLKIICRWSI